MQTAKEIRTANLRLLVAEFESIQKVSELAGSSRVYLCQILLGTPSTTGTARGVGDALARRLESACGKPVGWMDCLHDGKSGGKGAHSTVPLRKYPVLSLSRARDWRARSKHFMEEPISEWQPSLFELGANGFVVRVTAESAPGSKAMPHPFPDGTLLFVDPEQAPRCGSCVIVSRSGNASPMLRRVVFVDGRTHFEAVNSRGPSAHSGIRKNDRLLGVVVFARFDFA